MSTRISQEARIRRYFSNSPLGEATVMLNLVKDIVGERVSLPPFEYPSTPAKPKRKYIRKVKKQEAPETSEQE